MPQLPSPASRLVHAQDTMARHPAEHRLEFLVVDRQTYGGTQGFCWLPSPHAGLHRPSHVPAFFSDEEGRAQ